MIAPDSALFGRVSCIEVNTTHARIYTVLAKALCPKRGPANMFSQSLAQR